MKTTPNTVQQLDLIIHNATGLHARPAKTFVKLAKKFKSRVQITHGDQQVNGKSLIGVLKLGVKRSGEIRITVDGSDEEAALQALRRAVEEGLGEATHAPPPKTAVETPRSNGSNGHVSTKNMLVGVPASNGIAIGKTWQYVPPQADLPQQFTGVEAESNLLDQALAAARQTTHTLRTQTEQQAGAEEAAIFEAQLELLDDPDLRQSALDAIQNGQNAAHAWRNVVKTNADSLAALSDALLAARAADMRDVGERVLQFWTGSTAPAMPETPFILLASDLSPSLTASLDKERVQGICTAVGGPNAHAAILARAFRLPAVVGVGEKLLSIADGTQVIVNGKTGTVALSPSDAAIDAAQKAQQASLDSYRVALAQSAEIARTQDGHHIEVVANVGGVPDAQEAFRLGAEGVGLLRTEFLFLKRDGAPTVEEQTTVYGDILEALNGQPVIIRTLDVGGDKPLPYINVPHEENPFLGERGIRLCLNRPELFRAQLTAIARASRRGHARVMFPMVSDVSELMRARQMLHEACAAEGVPPLEVGIMVEVPSAAMMADIFAPHVDFFSIGTNDLTQYTLAVDRMHPTLSKQSDGLHPAVLRLIAQTTKAAKAAGKWVGICGELGADPQAAPILIGLGVAELSVAVPAVPTVKAQIRTLTLSDAQQLAQQALNCPTAQAVRALNAVQK